jgi:hypothetical protein
MSGPGWSIDANGNASFANGAASFSGGSAGSGTIGGNSFTGSSLGLDNASLNNVQQTWQRLVYLAGISGTENSFSFYVPKMAPNLKAKGSITIPPMSVTIDGKTGSTPSKTISVELQVSDDGNVNGWDQVTKMLT